MDDIEEVEAVKVPEGMRMAEEAVGDGVDVRELPTKEMCRCPLCGEAVGISTNGVPTFHILNRHPETTVAKFKEEWLGRLETWTEMCSEEDVRKREKRKRERKAEYENGADKRRRMKSANYNKSLRLLHDLDRKMMQPPRDQDKYVDDVHEQMLRQLDVLPEWQKLGLGEKAMTFVALYVTNGFDAKAAFKAAFNQRPVCGNGARYTAETYLQRRDVQKLITAYMNQWLKVKGQELNHILVDTLYNMAFYDPADIVNPDGSPAFDRWEDIPVSVRRCIDHIETKYYGKDADRYAISVTMTDRKKAIESLSKFFAIMRGSFTEAEQSVGNVTPETELLLQSVLGGSRKVEPMGAAPKALEEGGESPIGDIGSIGIPSVADDVADEIVIGKAVRQ